MIKNVPHPSRGPSTTVSLRSDFSMEASQQLTFMSYPLRICSGLCCAGSLLVQFTSLSTSYWVLESTQKGLVHSGLWKICINTKCTMYQFNLLALHIHVTRGFLLMACLCGLISLLCVCFSFEHMELYHISVLKAAVVLSFSGGLFILMGMSVFTAVYRNSHSYTNYLLYFGSSYGLGWASLPMYAMTGILLMLTQKTMVSELWVPPLP
ncbi:protein NKG7 [Pogona vitticeps]